MYPFRPLLTLFSGEAEFDKDCTSQLRPLRSASLLSDNHSWLARSSLRDAGRLFAPATKVHPRFFLTLSFSSPSTFPPLRLSLTHYTQPSSDTRSEAMTRNNDFDSLRLRRMCSIQLQKRNSTGKCPTIDLSYWISRERFPRNSDLP